MKGCEISLNHMSVYRMVQMKFIILKNNFLKSYNSPKHLNF
jgi:hypothetical protein